MKDLIEELKLKKLLKEEKKCSPVTIALMVLGVIALIGAVVYMIYRFFAPDYLDDFEEDDFEDDLDDDFFEDDEIIILDDEEEKKETSDEKKEDEIFAEE